MERDITNKNEIKRDNKIYFVWLFVSIIALLVVFIVSIFVGRYKVDFLNLFQNLFNNGTINETDVNIILHLRIPRIIMALIVGAALSVSGLVYQATFNNKLISSDLLGVSSGACVGAAIGILIGLNTMLCTIISFFTGIGAVLLTLFIPKVIKNKSSLALVLSGIIVSGIMNSILGLIKFLVDKEDVLASIVFWTMGDLSTSNYSKILYIMPIVVISLTILLFIRWKINILSLGEVQAKSVGLDYRKYRAIVIVCSTLLTACAVSVCGNIGWISLIIPHVSQFLVGDNMKKTLPITTIIGAVFMVIVDDFARSLSPNEIPLSILTGFIGAGLYLIVLFVKKKEIR